MPTYTYQCKKCGHAQDIFHGINARPRVKCAECGGRCTRLIGAGAGILFKGSGFYATDYKSKNNNAPSKDGSETSGKNTGASDTKTAKNGTPANTDQRKE